MAIRLYILIKSNKSLQSNHSFSLTHFLSSSPDMLPMLLAIIFTNKPMKYTSKFKPNTNHIDQQPRNKIQPKTEQPCHTDSQNRFYNQIGHAKQHHISYFQNDSHKVTAIKLISKQHQKSISDQNRFSKMSNLLSNIMTKHGEMKQKIEHLKKQKENKENASLMQLTFEPKLTSNPRYVINSRMQERNKSWDEARAHHSTSIRQELVEKQVKQCTFSPHIISKPKSKQYLRGRSERTHKSRDNGRQNEEMNMQGKFMMMHQRQLNTKFESKRVKGSIDINSIKSMIKSQMSRIVFDY